MEGLEEEEDPYNYAGSRLTEDLQYQHVVSRIIWSSIDASREERRKNRACCRRIKYAGPKDRWSYLTSSEASDLVELCAQEESEEWETI